VDPANLFRSGKIGDCPRHSDHAMETARGKAHRHSRIGKQLPSGLVGGRDPFKQLAVGFGIRADTGTVVAVCLALSRCSYAARDFRTPLCRRRKRKIGSGDALHLDVKVDTVEQRA
jgi:hypothetical protein